MQPDTTSPQTPESTPLQPAAAPVEVNTQAVSPSESVAPAQPVASPVFPADERIDEAQNENSPVQLPGVEPIQWRAPEYIQHDRSPLWYVGFVSAVVALVIIALLVIQSITFVVLILVMAVALMVYTHRPMSDLNYVLSEKGLYINDQLHPLGEFKGFGVLHDGVQNSLVLIPVKRFRPSLTVYFPTEIGERLVDMTGAYLPMREVKLDAFDKIVRRLRI